MELRKSKRTLKRANAKPLSDGNYAVIAHPDTSYDLEGDSNITNVWVQGGGLGKGADYWEPTLRKLPLGFTYYESSICPISRASGYGDVYNTFVIGEEAYGTVKLDSMPAKVIWHPPGSSGVSDPLDQVGTLGRTNSAEPKLRVITGKGYSPSSRRTMLTRGKQAVQPFKLAA